MPTPSRNRWPGSRSLRLGLLALALLVCPAALPALESGGPRVPIEEALIGIDPQWHQRAREIASQHAFTRDGTLPEDAIRGLNWMFREALRQRALGPSAPPFTSDDLQRIGSMLYTLSQNCIECDHRFPDKPAARQHNQLRSNAFVDRLAQRLETIRADPLFPGCKSPLSASQALRALKGVLGTRAPDPAIADGPIADRPIKSINEFYELAEQLAVLYICLEGHTDRMLAEMANGPGPEYKGAGGTWPYHIWLAPPRSSTPAHSR